MTGFMIKQIKVLVVDDSAFMRKVISDLLEEDPRIKVIDRARNGKEAVEKVIKLQPDVVTLDVEMPQDRKSTRLNSSHT